MRKLPLDLVPAEINGKIVQMLANGTISRQTARDLLDVYIVLGLRKRQA